MVYPERSKNPIDQQNNGSKPNDLITPKKDIPKPNSRNFSQGLKPNSQSYAYFISHDDTIK